MTKLNEHEKFINNIIKLNTARATDVVNRNNNDDNGNFSCSDLFEIPTFNSIVNIILN